MRPGPVFVVPEQRAPSGGATYNAEVVAALRSRGVDAVTRVVPGGWPDADRIGHEALTAALAEIPRDRSIVLDGLVGSVCATEIRAARARGASIALLVHLPLPAETGLSDDDRRRLAAAEAEAVAAASTVLATSHWAADSVGDRYERAVTPVLPGAVRRPLAEGSDPPRLLMLGSLTTRKNHLVVLRALADLTDLPWSLDLVGPDGDATPPIRSMLENEAVPRDRVQVSGALTGTALEEVWHRTDLLLLPSLAETFGLVVTEALAHGLPAMVSAGTGAVEALSGGRTDDPPGCSLDPRDPLGWASALREWLTDDALRRRWSTAARERRAALRTWDDAAIDLLRTLDTVAR